MQDALGAATAEGDRFVGGEEGNLDTLQSSLDCQAFEGPASDSGDVLANDDIEASIGVCSLLEQIADTTVSWNRDVEALVAFTSASINRSCGW
ncbi:hypothetical protein [Amycolatopsis sp. NPDC049868]|uniref:hypothetical protein n=1 Tax=Amycolatopsis sp. NPDC049868 TaxID=3363934 RepID=UPI00379AF27E